MRRWPTLALLLLGRCSEGAEPSRPVEAPAHVEKETASAPTIDASTIRRYTAALAHDQMQGRGTGSEGGRRATAWIAARMEEIGLLVERQPVSLVAYDTRVDEAPLGAIIHSEREAGSYDETWPLVDVGFGIVAAEYDRDDYAGLSVDGAIVVARSGEPSEPGAFDGDALTEHGRWTTKLQRARERGAAGCLLVHDTEGASYPWSVVESSFEGERFAAAPGPSRPLQLWGWVAEAPSSKRLTARFEQRVRAVQEHNVLGRIGSGHAPFVVVTAHWDHLGKTEAGVFNGAMDNASGVASLLALARAVKTRHDTKPLAGTVVFAATAAEEAGLYGATSLAASMRDLDIVAAINLDGMNVGPVTPTVELIAPGLSTLDDLFAAAVQRQGRRVLDDRSPSDGAAFRSDHAPFAARGIPTLYPQPGYSTVSDPALLAFAKERTRRYHTTDDKFDGSWSFEGSVADITALYEVLVDLADAKVRPRRTNR